MKIWRREKGRRALIIDGGLEGDMQEVQQDCWYSLEEGGTLRHSASELNADGSKTCKQCLCMHENERVFFMSIPINACVLSSERYTRVAIYECVWEITFQKPKPACRLTHCCGLNLIFIDLSWETQTILSHAVLAAAVDLGGSSSKNMARSEDLHACWCICFLLSHISAFIALKINTAKFRISCCILHASILKFIQICMQAQHFKLNSIWSSI